MALARSWAWVKILEYQCVHQIWTPFDKAFADCLEEGQNFEIAQRLVGELDGVGSSLHGMCECGQG